MMILSITKMLDFGGGRGLKIDKFRSQNGFESNKSCMRSDKIVATRLRKSNLEGGPQGKWLYGGWIDPYPKDFLKIFGEVVCEEAP